MPPKSSNLSGDDGLLDSWGRRNRKLADRLCAKCGRLFRPAKASSAYCSRPCARSKNGGHNRKDGPTWWVNAKGYIEGRVWVDGVRVGVKQHRWIMEQHLGRPLSPTEDVHHRNGSKSDNRLENLELIDHGAHSIITNRQRKHRRGYKLNLTSAQRAERSERMRRMRAAQKR